MDTDTAALDEDERRLRALGYKQTLNRILGLFENFSVTFGTVGFVSGVSALYAFSIPQGGPMAMFVNWVVIACLATITSMVMAEICSSMPTAGGIYFWAGRLGGKTFGPFLAWLTAIWNFAGWTVTLSAVCQGNSLFVLSFYMLYTGQTDYPVTETAGLQAQFVITTILILISYVVNIVNEEVIKWFLRISSLLFFVQYFLYMIWMPVAWSRSHDFNSASEVFGNFINQTGWEQQGLAWMLGFLYPSYVFYGYDASGHIAEETVMASQRAAHGMWTSILSSAILSIPQLVIMLYCTNFNDVLKSPYANGVVTQWYEAVGYTGTFFFLSFQIITGIATACSVILSAARVGYAISRDRVLPLGWLWSSTNSQRLPVYSVSLVALLAIAAATLILNSSVAFQALGSMGTISVLLSYVFPLLGRLISRKSFQRGPFHLGRATEPLCVLCICYILFISIALCIPYGPGWNAQTFNYASITIGAITFLSLLSWFIYAQFWYKGPGMHAVPPSYSDLQQWYLFCRCGKRSSSAGGKSVDAEYNLDSQVSNGSLHHLASPTGSDTPFASPAGAPNGHSGEAASAGAANSHSGEVIFRRGSTIESTAIPP